jgi:hypothetical protein
LYIRARMPLRSAIVPLLLAAAILVYYPGLKSGFLFDDYPNIVHNQELHLQHLDPEKLRRAALSLNSGPLKRPLSALSFALNFYVTGLDPYFFKLVNLAIHLVNGVLVFWLTYLLLSAYRRQSSALSIQRARWLSLAVCAAWLLHPMNVTGVLYIVQRMASLSALFVFAGLALFMLGRLRQLEGKNGWPAIFSGLLVMGPLATLSKENGALLPFLMLIAEVTLLSFEPARNRRQLTVFFFVVAILPALVIGGYLLTQLDWLRSTYIVRNFTLEERLLTEPRVAWFYLSMSLLPNLSRLGFYHDDIPLSHSLWEPSGTVWAIGGLIALLAIALASRRRAPLLAFGLLFFLVAHSMESSVFSLEIAHEHRNYLPLYGILLPTLYYLTVPLGTRTNRRLRSSGAVLAILALVFATTVRTSHWADPLDHALIQVNNHPASPRSQYWAGQIYELLSEQYPSDPEYYRRAYEYLHRAYLADPTGSSGLFGLLRLSSVHGRPPRPEWVEELERRLRHFPFRPANTTFLSNLGQCRIADKCRLSDEVVDRLFGAALNNPRIHPHARASVLNEAMAQALFEGNLEAARAYGSEAVHTHPRQAQYRLNLALVLIQSQRLDEATALLDETERLSAITPIQYDRIASLRQMIAVPSSQTDARDRAAPVSPPTTHDPLPTIP